MTGVEGGAGSGATAQQAVLVTGGCGYIGSHTVRALHERGDAVVVLDDLSQGFADALPSGVPLVHADVADRARVATALRAHQVRAVLHFAGRIQVGESVRRPGDYFSANVGGTLALLQAMADAGARHLVFSSTAAIFGDPLKPRMDEDHPCAPVNPYGRSKWLVEQMLPDFEAAHGIRSVCLRYFNAAGAWPDASIGERHQPETHLIPLAIRAALGIGPALSVFGDDWPTPDGTCVRDYVHACDLADAHLRALDHLRAGGQSLRLNLGTGTGFSVRQVLNAVAQAVGRQVPHRVLGRRAGDPAVLVADATQAGERLGWRPRFDEEAIVAHALAWHRRDG